MSRIIRIIVAALSVLTLVALVGCRGEQEPQLEPKVAPPAVREAGVLRVGVDLSMPPFAGEDGGQKAGIDVDVAAALGDRLGLEVEFVDVASSEVATALAQGTVDVAFSVPVAEADLERMSVAGTYITDAPAIFVPSDDSSVESTLTLETMPTRKTAVQENSPSFWLLRSEFDEETVVSHRTLREALDSAAKGEVPQAAGSAVVGTYIIRDMPALRFAGQLAPGSQLGVVTAAENLTLSDAVREALDALAADGVLDSVRRKWVGDLPQLESPDESAEETAAP